MHTFLWCGGESEGGGGLTIEFEDLVIALILITPAAKMRLGVRSSVVVSR